MTAPAITVVCPTYNAASFVLASLQTVANQTQPPVALIVSDDGSDDGTPDLVAGYFSGQHSFRTQLLRNRHRGPGAARNAGICAATSEWIAFLDSDDEWLPEKLARVASAIATDDHVNIYCHSEIHRRLDGSTGVLDYGALYDPTENLGRQLFRRNLFSTSAVVCRRDALLRAGLFDEQLPSTQDYELWLRMAPQLVASFIREPLGCYVDRPSNITSTFPYRRIMNRASVLWRHRRLGGGGWFLLCSMAIARGVLSAAKQDLSKRARKLFARA